MIIIGYQGIGKSTLAGKNNCIDLESGNFWHNGARPYDWYVYYCQIAEHLSQQGYTVFVSSHEVVRNLLKKHSKEALFVVCPAIELKEAWIDKLKKRFESSKLEKDFKVIILSNSNKNRVRPFKEKLNVDSSFSSKKPFKKKYKKIMNLYNFKDTEIAVIGDVLLTDILGGNRMGFTTILVNGISEDEPFMTSLVRSIESHIIKKLNKKGILFKGEYYE